MFLFQTQGVKIEVFVENREMSDNMEFPFLFTTRVIGIHISCSSNQE